MEIREAVLKLAKACEVVFDLTGRSVPSNHSAKLKEEQANIKTLIKELENVGTSGNTTDTPAV